MEICEICGLDAFKSENEGLDENGDVQKQIFVADIVQVIIHVCMDGFFTIPAQLTVRFCNLPKTALG